MNEIRHPSSNPPGSLGYSVGVVEWFPEQDGLAQVIQDELLRLGHQAMLFSHDAALPRGLDVVFSYAPYGRFHPVARRVGEIPADKRPTMVHWNTEGLPDLRIPWPIVRSVGALRAWLGRVGGTLQDNGRLPFGRFLRKFENRILRYRYVGDYYHAYQKGWLKVFADSSAVYASIHRKHGLPTVVAPWGSTPLWYGNLGTERDIDVLWMGQYGSKRRKLLLQQVTGQLRRHGVRVHIADNVESSFIFGKERTRYLNRAKITLNLTRTWYDDNYSRFAMAAPNRSMIVSEPLVQHCPEYIPGTHYIAAPIENLSSAIIQYLNDDAARNEIVENAYQLVTTELAFQNSIRKIMDEVARVRGD